MASKKSRPKKSRPLDAELFELADKVALIFDRPEAAPMRAKLFQEATAYRDRIRHHGPADRWATTTKWTAFLLRMILTCPRILSRPPEFEWVMDDLEWILTSRNWDPKFERDFWNAVTRVKKVMWTGHPHDKALDYFRFNTVQSLMNPPVQLKGIVATSLKSQAVERAADMEGNLLGKRPHERVVYRSHEKVERELKKLNELLRPPFLGPPPTNKLDTEHEEITKKTKERMMQSKHQKRVRRK
jgi:hypothetical protein